MQENGEISAAQFPEVLAKYQLSLTGTPPVSPGRLAQIKAAKARKKARENLAGLEDDELDEFLAGLGGKGVGTADDPSQTMEARLALERDQRRKNEKNLFAGRVKDFSEDKLGEPPAADATSVALFLRMLDPRKLEFELLKSDRHDLELSHLISEFAAKKTGTDDDEKHKLRTLTHLNIKKHVDKSNVLSLAPDVVIWAERWLARADFITDPVVRTAMAEHHRIMTELDAAEGWLLTVSYERQLSVIIRHAKHLHFPLLKQTALAEARTSLALAKKRASRK